jgi:hypothetical protein
MGTIPKETQIGLPSKVRSKSHSKCGFEGENQISEMLMPSGAPQLSAFFKRRFFPVRT